MRIFAGRPVTVLALLAALACGKAPDADGIANVAGVAWQSDSAPMGNQPVIVTCVDALVSDTARTDAQGHYTISLFSNFSMASVFCTATGPDRLNPKASGTELIFFQPSDESHPVQIIDLLPVAAP